MRMKVVFLRPEHSCTVVMQADKEHAHDGLLKTIDHLKQMTRRTAPYMNFIIVPAGVEMAAFIGTKAAKEDGDTGIPFTVTRAPF